MTITFAEQSAVNVSTTPISLINGTSTIATVSTKAIVQVFIDTTNVIAGDAFDVKLLEKVVSGGSQRSLLLGTISATQNGYFLSPSVIVGNGWDITITRTGGADRAFDWSVREVN